MLGPDDSVQKELLILGCPGLDQRANRHKQTMPSSTIGCLLSFVSGLFQIAGKGKEGNDKISQK